MYSTNVVDDTDARLDYHGDWDFDTSLQNTVDGTRHGTNTAGAWVAFAFTGTGVTVVGIWDPADGSGMPATTYEIDGRPLPGATASTSGQLQLNVTFCAIHNLSNENHRLVITYQKGKQRSKFWLDYLVFDVPGDPESPPAQTPASTSSLPSMSLSVPQNTTLTTVNTSSPTPTVLPSPSIFSGSHPDRAPVNSPTGTPSTHTSATLALVETVTSTSNGSTLSVYLSPGSITASSSSSLVTISEVGGVGTTSQGSNPSPAQDIHHMNIGAIVGGVIGGAVCIIVIVQLLLYMRRRYNATTASAVARPRSIADDMSYTDVGDDFSPAYLKFEDLEVQQPMGAHHNASQDPLVPNRAAVAPFAFE